MEHAAEEMSSDIEQQATSSDEGASDTSLTGQQKMSAVATTTAEGTKDVARQAQSQIRQVAEETKYQIRNLADEGREQLRSQAEVQTQRASDNLRTLSDQTRALAEGRTAEAGPLAGYVGDMSGRLTSLAERLEQRGFDGVVTDVQGFARRRPLAFVGICALAGVAVSRMARTARSDGQGRQTSTPNQTWAADPTSTSRPLAADPMASDPTAAGGMGGS